MPTAMTMPEKVQRERMLVAGKMMGEPDAEKSAKRAADNE